MEAPNQEIYLFFKWCYEKYTELNNIKKNIKDYDASKISQDCNKYFIINWKWIEDKKQIIYNFLRDKNIHPDITQINDDIKNIFPEVIISNFKTINDINNNINLKTGSDEKQINIDELQKFFIINNDLNNILKNKIDKSLQIYGIFINKKFIYFLKENFSDNNFFGLLMKDGENRKDNFFGEDEYEFIVYPENNSCFKEALDYFINSENSEILKYLDVNNKELKKTYNYNIPNKNIKIEVFFKSKPEKVQKDINFNSENTFALDMNLKDNRNQNMNEIINVNINNGNNRINDNYNNEMRKNNNIIHSNNILLMDYNTNYVINNSIKVNDNRKNPISDNNINNNNNNINNNNNVIDRNNYMNNNMNDNIVNSNNINNSNKNNKNMNNNDMNNNSNMTNNNMNNNNMNNINMSNNNINNNDINNHLDMSNNNVNNNGMNNINMSNNNINNNDMNNINLSNNNINNNNIINNMNMDNINNNMHMNNMNNINMNNNNEINMNNNFINGNNIKDINMNIDNRGNNNYINKKRSNNFINDNNLENINNDIIRNNSINNNMNNNNMTNNLNDINIKGNINNNFMNNNMNNNQNNVNMKDNLEDNNNLNNNMNDNMNDNMNNNMNNNNFNDINMNNNNMNNNIMNSINMNNDMNYINMNNNMENNNINNIKDCMNNNNINNNMNNNMNNNFVNNNINNNINTDNTSNFNMINNLDENNNNTMNENNIKNFMNNNNNINMNNDMNNLIINQNNMNNNNINNNNMNNDMNNYIINQNNMNNNVNMNNDINNYIINQNNMNNNNMNNNNMNMKMNNDMNNFIINQNNMNNNIMINNMNDDNSNNNFNNNNNYINNNNFIDNNMNNGNMNIYMNNMNCNAMNNNNINNFPNYIVNNMDQYNGNNLNKNMFENNINILNESNPQNNKDNQQNNKENNINLNNINNNNINNNNNFENNDIQNNIKNNNMNNNIINNINFFFENKFNNQKYININDNKTKKIFTDYYKNEVEILKNNKNKKNIRKKININFNDPKNQKQIKYILQSIVENENKLNIIISSSNKNNNNLLYYIIPRNIIDDLKQLFNYDYFKATNIYDVQKILLQRQNNPDFYIDKINQVTIQDFEDNNISIIDEDTLFSLYYLFPTLENHKDDFLFDIYLKDNKGIIIIKKINNNKYFYIFEVNNCNITQIKNCDLIDFFENEDAFNTLSNELKTYNINNDIWNEIINLYSINCNFIMNNTNLNLNKKIESIMNKVNQLKGYFQSNPNKNNKEIYIKKIQGYYSSLFSLEKLLKQKETILTQNLKSFQGFNSNNNFNNAFNIRDTNVIFDTSNLYQNNINNQNNNINYINNNNNNNNNNYRNIIINGKVKINRKNPSLGLSNIGSTCYMNATVQCLAHLPEITEELIKIYFDAKNSNNFVNYIQTHNLSIEYTKLLIEIFFPLRDKKAFPPFDFKQTLGNQESMFGNNEAEDAKDLYIFLIETMNNELNGGIPAVYNDILRLNIDPRDPKKIKETFLNEFKRKNNTPFSNYLYGFSQTCSICSSCRCKMYNFECFNVLSFPLLDVKNFIRQNINNYNQYTLSLNDCFTYYLKTDFYNGDNQLYCKACNSKQDSCLERIIDSTPKILVIILDRGLDNKDFTEDFNFYEILDLSSFVSKDSISQYYLCGVITHLGESGPTGHFIAYCKMEASSSWYKYNDSEVTLVNNSQEIINRGKPYILFYHYYG